MSGAPGSGTDDGRSKITGAVVDFLEDHGVTTYAFKRSPSAIVISLPNEPEVSVQHHLEGLRSRLQEMVFAAAPDHGTDERVLRDPRDHHAIIIEIVSPRDGRTDRDAIVTTLRNAEPELRRRGIESLLLFGSAATLEPHPNDVDLLARFEPAVQLSAFDVAGMQIFLEQILGRRVDLSSERTFPTTFRDAAERSGIRIYGA